MSLGCKIFWHNWENKGTYISVEDKTTAISPWVCKTCGETHNQPVLLLKSFEAKK